MRFVTSTVYFLYGPDAGTVFDAVDEAFRPFGSNSTLLDYGVGEETLEMMVRLTRERGLSWSSSWSHRDARAPYFSQVMEEYLSPLRSVLHDLHAIGFDFGFLISDLDDMGMEECQYHIRRPAEDCPLPEPELLWKGAVGDDDHVEISKLVPVHFRRPRRPLFGRRPPGEGMDEFLAVIYGGF